MSSVVISKESIFMDELIRENARLTIQHEADRQIIERLEEQIQELEYRTQEAVTAASRVVGLETEANTAKAMLDATTGKLDGAIKALHFVMAGGDSCQICSRTCMMGEQDCQPEWIGEKRRGDLR